MVLWVLQEGQNPVEGEVGCRLSLVCAEKGVDQGVHRPLTVSVKEVEVSSEGTGHNHVQGMVMNVVPRSHQRG
ncbi:hypothetical protein GUJ93_ZPchr0002g24012 [Zizania palustris]|uniref:Uncharacterized protein n=1 Tax=Zizania palustris TaxID=103762 RepID=A0A8J5VUR1_ZIZPA|nr:hypothetical protein GUJ93_ZPchr0002g24012 [Zizania palustris]